MRTKPENFEMQVARMPAERFDTQMENKKATKTTPSPPRKNAVKKGIDVREAIRRWHRGDETVVVRGVAASTDSFPVSHRRQMNK